MVFDFNENGAKTLEKKVIRKTFGPELDVLNMQCYITKDIVTYSL
jgi:hypothetical protein